MKRAVPIAVLYIASMTFWVYGVLEPSVGFGSDVAAVIGFAGLIAFHLGVGFALARGWAPLLAFAPPLIAYPAGYADRGEFLIWQGLALVAPIGALLLFAGVALRYMLLSRRPRPA
jgi:hypothetical protein